MSKHHLSNRLSAPKSKAIDYKARKRIEELYLLTDEIINQYHDIRYKYDYKLYRKYNKLKQINIQLQEKLINQHCSGCNCHHQSNEDLDQPVLYIDSQDSSIMENETTNSSINCYKKSENSSDNEENEEQTDTIENVPETTRNENVIEKEKASIDSNKKSDNSLDNEENEEQIDTNEHVPETTRNEDAIEKEKGNGLSGLPVMVQAIIKEKVQQCQYDKAYLLKVGLYPTICKFLRVKLRSEIDCRPSQATVHSFILDQFKPLFTDYHETSLRIRNELRDIHRLYVTRYAERKYNKIPTRRSERQQRSI